HQREVGRRLIVPMIADALVDHAEVVQHLVWPVVLRLQMPHDVWKTVPADPKRRDAVRGGLAAHRAREEPGSEAALERRGQVARDPRRRVCFGERGMLVRRRCRQLSLHASSVRDQMESGVRRVRCPVRSARRSSRKLRTGARVTPCGPTTHERGRRSVPTACCSSVSPSISASGRGGHPGTYTSTGMKLSTPCTTLYTSNMPPEFAHEPIEMTQRGSIICS